MSDIYVMEPTALSKYIQARNEFTLDAGFNIPVAEPGSYTVVDGVAHFNVTGVLSGTRDIFDLIFGTAASITYPEMVSLLDEAQNDPNVKSAVFHIDSSGGHFDGLEEAVMAIATFPKPTKTEVSGRAASAAFWMASQTDKIIAKTRTASFGSIGVVVAMRPDDTRIEITSTAAPKKRPDVTTDDGKAVIREWLDQIHEIFAGDVARGRGVTIEQVNADFGQGGCLLAANAKKAGMIDEAPEALTEILKNTAVGGKAGEANILKGEQKMTLEELKGQHPEAFTAAKAEGIAEGAKAERERVSGLTAWRGISAEADKVVEDAISNGKTYLEVAAQLAAAVAKGQTLAGENAPMVETGTEEKTDLTDDERETMKMFDLTAEQVKATRKGVK